MSGSAFACVSFALLLVGSLGTTAANGTSPMSAYSVCFGKGAAPACMDVSVDASAQLIGYHMAQAEDFEEVSMMEDYESGFAASLVPSQDACYVRMLVNTFGEQVAQIQSMASQGMGEQSSSAVSAVPLENAEEEVGSRIAAFCGDAPVYKLVKAEEPSQEVMGEEGALEARQVSQTYRRCVILLLVWKCYTTTITLPTGSSITYVWIWG